jgi:hypothetical protein
MLHFSWECIYSLWLASFCTSRFQIEAVLILWICRVRLCWQAEGRLTQSKTPMSRRGKIGAVFIVYIGRVRLCWHAEGRLRLCFYFVYAEWDSADMQRVGWGFTYIVYTQSETLIACRGQTEALLILCKGIVRLCWHAEGRLRLCLYCVYAEWDSANTQKAGWGST